jgi:hypothetical protein
MNEESIQSQGGRARAQSLSKEELKAIASKAAAARWAGRPAQATHKGNFKEEFGIDVECYVLDDQNKTAVLSERGMGRALGLSSTGGNKLQSFLATKTMSALIGPELRQKLAQPIKFQWGTGGPELPPTIIHGYDATTLIDVCLAITLAEASGVLSLRQKRVAAQSHIITGASAKGGIKGLVYALAGYNPSAEEVIAAFKMYVHEEAKKYEKEFPNELYMQWHRLYDIPVPVRGKPWNFKHLTVKHIYYPLAKSNGKILQLIRALKSKTGDRQKKLFQFLSEVGARALRIQIGRVLEMSESSNDSAAYEKKIVDRFGGQKELEFVSQPAATK